MQGQKYQVIITVVLLIVVLAILAPGCGSGDTRAVYGNNDPPFYTDRVVEVRLVTAEENWESMLENPLIEGFLLDRTPAGRVGDPADVAHVAAFLASDEAGFVNGSIVFADGGITAGLYSGAVKAMMDADVSS